MLTNGGKQFITREKFNKSLIKSTAPKDYSFDDYLADALEIGSYDKSDIIDALISIINNLEELKNV